MNQEQAAPLSVEEHRELVAEIHTTNQRLQMLCNLVVKIYGPENRTAATFAKVIDSLDRLEADLHVQAMADAAR